VRLSDKAIDFINHKKLSLSEVNNEVTSKLKLVMDIRACLTRL
jgi:hypothetical protein